MVDLEQTVRDVQRNIIMSIFHAKSGHPGGSLSAAHVLTLLYFEVMREQDIFILSKGHAAPCLYAVLAQKGLIPMESLSTLRHLSSPLQGHPSLQHLKEVHASSGSLGQAFSVACGYALAYHRQGLDRRVFVLLGDGECQEGIVTEAARIAAHYNLSNLVCLVDYNRKQSDRYSINFANPEAEFRAFGWSVTGCNGHDFAALRTALRLATEAERGPQCVVAHTVKGYPIKYMMDDPDSYHGSVCLSEQDVQEALECLNS